MNAAGTILNELLEISDADQRAQHLLRLCGHDDSLRQQVEGLLAASEEMGSFLDAPAIFGPEAMEILFPELEGLDDVDGRTFIPIGAIGEGGMGAVWLAQQTRPLERVVAIKLVKPGLNTQKVLARFDAERQILARLQHPNIATILDAGLLKGTTPFFVMEFVDGPPITQFADAEGLSIPDRVRLMTTVCRAIEHAHGRGIIHRDVKPGNVLVTLVDGVAVPKVIDFGIARALSADEPEDAVSRSLQSMTGTPEYTAPELLGGDRSKIGQSSDVYALGVLLRELLESAGTRPRDLSESSLAESEDPVVPPLPKRAKLRNCDEQLCRIVDLATHADPKIRYGSAKILADVLTDYSTFRTVAAVTPLSSGRALVRRLWLLPTVLVSGFVVFLIWEVVVSREYELGSRVSQTTRTGSDNLSESVASESLAGEISAARAALANIRMGLNESVKDRHWISVEERQSALEFWGKLASVAGTDSSGGLLRAEAGYALGVLEFVSGDLEAAAGRLVSATRDLRNQTRGADATSEVNLLIEQAQRILAVVRYCQGARQESRALFHEIQLSSATSPAARKETSERAVLRNVLLSHQLAEELSAAGRVREALQEYDFASGLLAEIRGAERSSGDFVKALFVNSYGCGRGLLAVDRKAEAVLRAQRACDLGSILMAGGGDSGGMGPAVSDAFLLAGSLLADLEQLDDAVIFLQRSAELAESSVSGESVDAEGLQRIRAWRQQLARVAVLRQQPEVAIRLLEQSREEFQRLDLRKVTASVMAARVRILRQLADLLVGAGRVADAITVFREVAQVCENAMAAGTDVRQFAEQRADSHYQTAKIRMEVGGDLRQLLREFEEAAADYEELLEEFPGNKAFQRGLAGSRYGLGVCNLRAQFLEQALDELSAALEIYELQLGEAPLDRQLREDVASCLLLGGKSLLAEQKFVSSAEWLRRCTIILVSGLQLHPQDEKFIQLLTEALHRLNAAESQARTLLDQP